ncbi:hypothetical protein H4219_005007 [Mycoemilia scoparia]|uniref:Glutathione S-transferase n=1 Tax=Mycoemilia scoparia TaxID=417184 RepID=A0A9W7ZZ81_9FUNG|nr:hypothetical protein H4219_005007 [Mycoemilia scoparia]
MSTSPSYELIYFNVPGLGEASRIILNLAGAKWKETNPEWPAFKPSTPFERLPVLIERSGGTEDFVLSESEVIERYLARKYGFISSDDPKLAAKQEQVRAQFSDARALATEVFHHKNETHRQRLEDQIKLIVRKHEELLEKNGSNGHYFGDKLTYPDIVAYVIINSLRIYKFDVHVNEENAPRLNKLYKLVEKAIAEVAAKKQ